MFIIYGFQSIDCSLTAENKSINTTKIKVRILGELEIKLLKKKKKKKPPNIIPDQSNSSFISALKPR